MIFALSYKEELFYYCNDATDRDKKEWRACSTKADAEKLGGHVDFPELTSSNELKAYMTDLFFAVRGGGSGAWGVFLACYYRAHQPQNKFNRIYQLKNNLFWGAVGQHGFPTLKNAYVSLGNISRRLLGMFVLRFINSDLYPEYKDWSAQLGYSDAWKVGGPGEGPDGVLRFGSEEARKFFLDKYAEFLDAETAKKEKSVYVDLLKDADTIYAKLKNDMIAAAKEVAPGEWNSFEKLPASMFPDSALDWLKNDYHGSNFPHREVQLKASPHDDSLPWFSDMLQFYTGVSYLNGVYGAKSKKIEKEILVESAPGAFIKTGPHYKYFPAAFFGKNKAPRDGWEKEFLDTFPSWGLHGAGGTARHFGARYDEEMV